MYPWEAGSPPALPHPRQALCERPVRTRPSSGAIAAGADPPLFLLSPPWPPSRTSPCAFPGCTIARFAARFHSERCCGIPASSARTSVSRYRRCPPSVRMEVSFPALAHRVTVFGSTRNMVATSAGVSRGSASGVRADMLTASPPGPVLRSCVLLLCLAPLGSLPWMSYMVYSDHIAITSGDKSTTRSKRFSTSRPVAPLIRVTLRDSSDTQRRNGQIRKSHPPLPIRFLARLPPPPATWPAAAGTWRLPAQTPCLPGR